MKTMMRQAVPLQPMEVNGGADIHLQPMEVHGGADIHLQPVEVHSGADIHLQPVEDPAPKQVDATYGGCDPVGSLCWSRLLPGPADPWREEPKLEQVCWQGL